MDGRWWCDLVLGGSRTNSVKTGCSLFKDIQVILREREIDGGKICISLPHHTHHERQILNTNKRKRIKVKASLIFEYVAYIFKITYIFKLHTVGRHLQTFVVQLQMTHLIMEWKLASKIFVIVSVRGTNIVCLMYCITMRQNCYCCNENANKLKIVYLISSIQIEFYL